ncbi:TolC family protein [Chishuiella sp.]|uniref:TolC family protein n=1 Tax=Chishuiella sp. TaxID=1969467 RepID=UPI0028A7DF1B|nr:TolC family protein [Chishuiella sp.]
MFKVIKYQLLAFFLMLSVDIYAQTEIDYNQLKLSEAIEIGINNNKKLQINSIKSQLSELKEKDLKNERYPDVNFLTGFHVLSTLKQFEHGLLHPATDYKVPNKKYNFTLSAEIPVYMGGKIKNEEKKAAIETEISELRVKRNVRELRMEIITAYLQILHLQEQEKLIQDKMHEDSAVIKQTQLLRKNGLVTNNEVLRTELQLSNHKMSFTELANDIAIVEHQVKTILSLPEDQDIHIDTSELFTTNDQIGLVDEMILEATTKDEELKIVNQDLELKKLDKKITQANVLPKITAGGEYGYNYPNFMFFPPQPHMYRFGMVGVNVTVPLSSFFKNKQKMRMADTNISIAKLEIEEKEEQIRHDVFASNRKLEEAIEKIKIAEEAIQQAQENYRIVKTKYINKLSLITELIDADNSYLEAESNMISLQINKQLKYYQLQYVLGNL